MSLSSIFATKNNPHDIGKTRSLCIAMPKGLTKRQTYNKLFNILQRYVLQRGIIEVLYLSNQNMIHLK